MKYDWPKGPTYWMEDNVLCVSIPFTWSLPVVRERIESNQSLLYSSVMVGGPAVALRPGYFNRLSFVVEAWKGGDSKGVMQRVNPMATKTSTGCPNHCPFCAVPRIEGVLRELEDWPDLPIITDNNLLACSTSHFDRVMDRLEKHDWCDFNQGLDAEILNEHHAERFARLRKPMIRLAMDSLQDYEVWLKAVEKLKRYGVTKNHIRTYVLVGFRDDPQQAEKKCDLVEEHGIKPLPMWFHALDAMEHNVVTKEQEALGWSDWRRRSLFQWFYYHKVAA